MRTPQLADNLRRAVLQAAIAGKLNDRTSEDARDLLAAIQTEKAAQQKTGKQKKSKPLAAINEEEIPFTIPENWVWVRLGDVFFMQAGKYIKADEITEKGEYPCFGGNGIRGYTKSFNREGHFPLIGRQGALCGNINIANGKFYATEHAVVVQMFADCDPLWAGYFLTALNLNQYATSTAQPGLSVEKISTTLIPIPPLTEQQQIVAKLNRLLNEIDSLKAQEQALITAQNAFPKKLRAALLQAAVQGELNERTDENARDLLAAIQAEKTALQKAGKLKKDKPLAAISEEEIPFTIPENWVWVRLGNITDYGIGKQIPPEKIPIGALVIEMEDIEKDTYCLLEKHRERTPKSSKNGFFAGDVLYGKLRPYLKKVVVANEDGFCSTEIIPFNGFGKINPQYLLFCMTSPFMLSNVNQLTYGMDMPRLGTNDARNLPIPLPPLTEQQQIVAKLEALLAEIEILENAS